MVMIHQRREEISVEEILSSLDNVKEETNGQYRADCPAHESKSGSALHIKVGENGKPVLHCFAGCSYEEIMRGLNFGGGSFPAPQNVTSINRPKTYKTEQVYSRPVFEFRLPSGEVAYVQRHKGAYYRPIGNDTWEASIKNVPRLPYNLPGLLDGVQNGETVYHLEGCKDCDTAGEWLEVPATTTGGAETWKSEFKNYYTGADVVILPDNDEPGLKYAETVARDLLQVAKSVKVVNLPGLPPGGDLTDFKESGGTEQEFFKVVQDTPVLNPSNPPNSPNPTNPPNSPNPPNPSVKSAAKLLKTEFAPTPWAVPGILPEGVTLLVGKPKKGKSWMALGFCEAIAAGGVALGTKKVAKGETLYLALEDNERRMQKRLKKVLNGRDCPAGMHYATEWPRLNEGGAEALEEWLDSNPGARLVVIDTLQKVRTPARGQNVYAEDYAALEALMPIAARYGVAIVVVHHLRKGEASDPQDMISGSTGLSGGVDGYLILHKSPGSQGPTLYVEGRDIEDPEEYALHWNLNTATWTIEGTAEEVHLSEERGAILVELNRSLEPMSPKELADVMPGKTHNSVKYLLHQMYHDDQVVRVSGKYEPANRTANRENPHGNGANTSTVSGVSGVRGGSLEHPLTCVCVECTI